MPEHYPWSSHACNAHDAHDPLITPHTSYLRLGDGDLMRCAAYRALFDGMLLAAEVAEIRAHAQQQRAWGSDRFRAQIAALTGRTVDVRPRGRPWSSKTENRR
ncbi:MAG: hypothetical protein ABIO58_03890 [Luteimonas sp.]